MRGMGRVGEWGGYRNISAKDVVVVVLLLYCTYLVDDEMMMKMTTTNIDVTSSSRLH